MRQLHLIKPHIILCTIAALLILILLGCTQEETPTTQAETPEAAPLSTSRPTATETPRINPDTPSPKSTTADQSTATLHATSPPFLTTPTAISQTRQTPTVTPPMGSLLSYNSEGIFQFPLETGRPTYLLSWPSDVVTKHASFSPDGNKVVFWQQSEATSELWFSELERWSPELLLTLPDTNYEYAVSDWLGTKRYLIFSLVRPNEIGLHTRVATYLIDTQKKEVVETLSGWEEMCPILAFSPRSKRAATWCSSDQGASYLVVETVGELWTTTEPPDQLLVEDENNIQEWSWSNNAEHVVFTDFINDTFDKQLYLISSENDQPIRLSNVKGTGYHAISLSANGEYFLNYSTCPDGIGCALIIHIPTGEIVWTSQAIPSLFLGLAWSPDGNYFVASDFDLFYIMELPTGQIIQEIDAVPHETLVWR